MFEDRAKNLYAKARDEEEKQRLLAALLMDCSAKDPIHQLFELAAFQLLIGAAAFGVAYAANYAGSILLPDAMRESVGYQIGLLVVFFLAVLAINVGFDGAKGEVRKEKVQQSVRHYAYPLTLLVGLMSGYYYHGYETRTSRESKVHSATLKACADMPGCVTLAREYNDGDDFRSYPPPSGR